MRCSAAATGEGRSDTGEDEQAGRTEAATTDLGPPHTARQQDPVMRLASA